MSRVGPVDKSDQVQNVKPLAKRNERRPEAEKETESASDMDRLVSELREAAANHPSMKEMDFRYDKDLDVVVVTIKDRATHRVLRQIPPEEVLRLTRLLRAGRQHLLDRLL